MARNMRMYSEYFGIRENAFAITPDPRYLFMSEPHREALAHLLFGTEEGGGFVQLTGEVGTGKTTICRAFLEQLPDNVDVALLLSPPESGRELLLAILTELRLPLPGHYALVRELVDVLNEYLLEAHANDRRTVVIIDEAQNIRPEVLEQVRLLTNLETPTHKLLQVFLIGQPELREKLEKPELRQVAQRITARYHLEPLGLPETEGYIRHRLAIAGCRQYLFTAAAIKRIYLESQGIPRVINILCDRALMGAFATDMAEVNDAIARYAAKEWQGRRMQGRRAVLPARLVIGVTVAGMLFAAALGVAINAPSHSFDDLLAFSRNSPGDDGETVIAMQPSHVERSPQQDQGNQYSDLAEHNIDTTGTSSALMAGAELTAEATTVESVPFPDAVVQRTAPEIVAQTQAIPAAMPEEIPVTVQDVVAAGAPVALQALLASWQIKGDSVDRSQLCDAVIWHGLRCLRDVGHWDELRGYNRPALLRLNTPQAGEDYLALVGISSEHVLVATADGPKQLPFADLEPVWGGEFILLWRPPREGLELIGAGSAGWAVKWLQEALARSDGQGAPAWKFDRTVAQRLRTFQQSRGLRADGIAGPRTLIHLNTLLGERVFPELLTEQTTPQV